jgi:drug/metabolite transporter (DMT)-like permease
MPRLAETGVLTLLALCAFAANSILTRLALGRGDLDAATFTAVRLVSGAVVLSALVRARSGSFGFLRLGSLDGGRGLIGPLALFAYAAPFTFAYVRIGAASGALLAFGSVQLTMIGSGIAAGERPGPRTWLGLIIAAGGLFWLMRPAVGRPDPFGSALMVVAGASWGIYSLAGKKAKDALAANARSFTWAVPLCLLLVALKLAPARIHARGVTLAVVSGAITSGVGYAIWYRALRGLRATQAAVLQLSVPVLAAIGAVVFLGETLGSRLAISGAAVLGGVAVALSDKRR